jgi:hypothetical protein
MIEWVLEQIRPFSDDDAWAIKPLRAHLDIDPDRCDDPGGDDEMGCALYLSCDLHPFACLRWTATPLDPLSTVSRIGALTVTLAGGHRITMGLQTDSDVGCSLCEVFPRGTVISGPPDLASSRGGLLLEQLKRMHAACPKIITGNGPGNPWYHYPDGTEG